jgi:hypothetical protein
VTARQNPPSERLADDVDKRYASMRLILIPKDPNPDPEPDPNRYHQSDLIHHDRQSSLSQPTISISYILL